MTLFQKSERQPFIGAALDASGVGTWDYDVTTDRLLCDSNFGRIYGLSDTEVEQGVSLTRVREAVHPDDRHGVEEKRSHMVRYGGLFVLEYRTLPAPGHQRWVLARGRYETDAHGHVLRGRGIVVDVTESKNDGYAEGRALFLQSERDHTINDALDRAAAHAIAAREAIDELASLQRRKLRSRADALLMAIGFQIAETKERVKH